MVHKIQVNKRPCHFLTKIDTHVKIENVSQNLFFFQCQHMNFCRKTYAKRPTNDFMPKSGIYEKS